jgi:hypothetical protein
VQLPLALATWGRAPAADPQKPSLWWCFHVFRGPGWEKKDDKITRRFLEVNFGHFLADSCYFFGAREEPKQYNLQCFAPLAWEKTFLHMLKTA